MLFKFLAKVNALRSIYNTLARHEQHINNIYANTTADPATADTAIVALPSQATDMKARITALETVSKFRAALFASTISGKNSTTNLITTTGAKGYVDHPGITVDAATNTITFNVDVNQNLKGKKVLISQSLNGVTTAAMTTDLTIKLRKRVGSVTSDLTDGNATITVKEANAMRVNESSVCGLTLPGSGQVTIVAESAAGDLSQINYAGYSVEVSSL